MSAVRTMGVSVTDTGTTQLLPLGFEYKDPAKGTDTGDQVWIYVKATEALVIGSVCSRALGATSYQVIKSPANTQAMNVVGVAQHVLLINNFGFILRKGFGSVLADSGGITANLGMMVGDAVGTADAAGGVGVTSFGQACTSVAGAVAANVWLYCTG